MSSGLESTFHDAAVLLVWITRALGAFAVIAAVLMIGEIRGVRLRVLLWALLAVMVAQQMSAATIKVDECDERPGATVDLAWFVPATVGTHQTRSAVSPTNPDLLTVEESELGKLWTRYRAAFGAQVGQERYDAALDWSADGRIDFRDFRQISDRFAGNPALVGDRARVEGLGKSGIAAGTCVEIWTLPGYFDPLDSLYQRCLAPGVEATGWFGPAVSSSAVTCP